jgi:DNA-binding CsgD family transcriptional regulator/tetratricopeptide (TPR) repeat protein
MAVGFMDSRLIDRAEELGRLLAASERVEQGKPVIVLLAGDAGAGKTRLIAELAGRVRQRGLRVLLGGCLGVSDVGVPYVPIVAALRDFAADAANEEWLVAAAKGLPGLERLLPELTGEALTTNALEGGLDQLQLFDSIRALLVRLSESAPILLVLEDLHWADRSTRDLFAFLMRTLHGRVALIGSYRSDGLDRRHPLSPLLAEFIRQPNVERLELAPFGRADVAEHLAAVSGKQLPGTAVDQIFARSEGNPFYTEELLAAGAHEADVRLPSTLADVLLARVEALSQPTQQLLRVIAVAGRRISHQLVVEATGWPELELEGQLREAITARVLVADASSETYAFRHALLQEAVYGDLLPGERTRLHATYARLLVGSGPAAELAYHCLASHDLRGALAARVRAAVDASAASAPSEAFRHLSHALELWEQVPDPAAGAGVDRVDLLLRTAEAANRSGEFQRSVTLARDAVGAIDTVTDPLRAAFAYERLGHYLLDVSTMDVSIEEVLHACRRAVELVPSDPLTPLRARVTVGLAEALFPARRHEEAGRWCNEALAVARATDSGDIEAYALITLGMLEFHRGDLDTARALVRDARARAATVRNRPLELRAQSYLGGLELEVGNPRAACAALTDASELAKHSGLAWSPTGVDTRRNHCFAHYVAGDWDTAERLAASVADSVPRFGELSIVGLYVEVGRGKPAAVDRLQWLATQGHDHQWVAYVAGGCQADMASWQGDLDRARALVQSTLARVDSSGDRWLLQRIWPAALGLAAEADRAEQARRAGHRSGLAETQALGRELLDRARAAMRGARSIGRRVGPEALAWLARAEAEWTRLEGSSDPERWRAAVDAFSYGYVYEVARCQWRLTEALLAGGHPEQATAVARAAYRTAVGLQAEPLCKALEVLARRSHLAIGARRGKSNAKGLTPRELEVLRLLVDGRSSRQIAETLFISGKTANVHVTNILAKLGAHSRLEAAARARELGLDDPAQPSRG